MSCSWALLWGVGDGLTTVGTATRGGCGSPLLVSAALPSAVGGPLLLICLGHCRVQWGPLLRLAGAALCQQGHQEGCAGGWGLQLWGCRGQGTLRSGLPLGAALIACHPMLHC